MDWLPKPDLPPSLLESDMGDNTQKKGVQSAKTKLTQTHTNIKGCMELALATG